MWLFRRSAQVDLLWDPAASAATKQARILSWPLPPLCMCMCMCIGVHPWENRTLSSVLHDRFWLEVHAGCPRSVFSEHSCSSMFKERVSSCTTCYRQREEQRSAVALEAWSQKLAWSTSRLDASVWLEAVGARALASQEHTRFEMSLDLM